MKGEEADLEAAKIANAMKDKDSKLGNWNFKAMLARKQLVIYGRYIFEYHADSIDRQYCSHLSNVDVYNFHIDPSCWWDDIEKAWWMWRGGIIKTRSQIEEWMKNGIYLRKEWKELLSGDGEDGKTPDSIDQENRYVTILQGDKVLHDKDHFNFYEWCLTYEGKRYYILVSERGKILKACLLTDIFPSDKFPFWTVAADPDLTEFWSLAPMDAVREPIQAKAVSINQMLDNSEAINHPMRAFSTDAIENPAFLKYRPDGLMPVKTWFNIRDAIQDFPIIPITTAVQVYDKLDIIIGTQSGVTNGARGNASEDKVGIYEGNMAQAADRFAMVGESEAHGQKRFAELYIEGVDEHLTSKFAIEMIGLDWVEYKEVTKKDLKRKRNFDIMVATAGSELSMEATDRRNKLTFLTNNKMNPLVNPKLVLEMEASIVGFNQDEIKALLEKDYGNRELMSECARDIQNIIAGKKIKPNIAANTSYLQKLQDFMVDNAENLTIEQQGDLQAYFDALQPIVMTNMTRQINEQRGQMWLPSTYAEARGEPMISGEQAPIEEPLANPQEQLQY